MSRTYRKKIDWEEGYSKKNKDGSQGEWTGKKITPYCKKGSRKFVFHRQGRKVNRQWEKLITKNANRSLKKAMRQELKKQLKEEYENYKSDPSYASGCNEKGSNDPRINLNI